MGYSHNKTIDNIQMLRALAALFVVLHHALPHYYAMGGTLSFIGALSKWGFVGVDIFFVISGYIMAYSTFNKERTLTNAKIFLKHRFARIYLGYLPFFLMMLLIRNSENPDTLTSLDFVGSLFLLNTNMYELVLPISWSLSYELYFYLLFVFTFFLPLKKLSLILPVLTLIVLIIALNTPQNQAVSLFYSPLLLEFFSGIFLYMFHTTIAKTKMLPITIAMIGIGYSYGIIHAVENGLLRVICYGSAAVGVVWLAIILEEKKLYKAHPFFVKLGDASYTLYLSHLIILELFFSIGLRGFFTSNTSILLPLLGLVAIIAICIICSIIYYRYIEKPLYKKAISLGENR